MERKPLTLQQQLNKLIHSKIIVKTEVEAVYGVFKGFDNSHHNGISCLILDAGSGPMLIKCWTAICTCEYVR